MRFEYHPDLVEQAVFLATRRDVRLERELHEAIDRVYEISDGDLRQRGFVHAYGELFGRWRLDGALLDVFREFPLIDRCVEKCIIAPAAQSRTQAADLFVKRADAPSTTPSRTLLIQLCPEAVIEADRTTAWLRRELYHVADMLDGEFGYAPEDLNGSSWEGKVLRDRYHVLWRSYVAGRLIRSGRGEGTALPALESAFRRAFTHHGHEPTDGDFTRVLNEPRLTHRQLLLWASRAELVIGAKTRLHPDGLGGTLPDREAPSCSNPASKGQMLPAAGNKESGGALESVHAPCGRAPTARRRRGKAMASGV